MLAKSIQRTPLWAADSKLAPVAIIKTNFEEILKNMEKCIQKKIVCVTHNEHVGKRINFIYLLTIFESQHG